MKTDARRFERNRAVSGGRDRARNTDIAIAPAPCQDRPVRPYYADVPVCPICGAAHNGSLGSGGWCGIRSMLFEAAA